MPPIKSLNPLGKAPLYTRISSWLLKTKSLLNLIIGDLLRLVLAIALFVAIVLAIFYGFTYKQWIPALSNFLSSVPTVAAPSE